MDSIKFGIFDVFGAILPGLPIFIILGFLIGGQGLSIEGVSTFTSDLSISQSLLILISCYMIGFSMQYISYEIFKPLVSLWGQKRTKGLPISIGKRGKEISRIRDLSPENFKVLNTFLALRTMCYNLFFSLLIFGTVSFVHSLLNSELDQEKAFIITSSIILSILFLRRAVSFHQWIQEMITEVNEVITEKLALTNHTPQSL